jgi:integrase
MRIGEALALERSNVDLDTGLITIRKTKGDRARLVPLHPTAVEALRHYASARDRLCPKPRSRAFFLSSAGTPVLAVSVRAEFREIMTRVGVRTHEVRPRIHDLRHRFAVQTLIDWLRAGADIDERIATLSTYLGHVSPADTYWYLSASPELMALAADKLHHRFGGVR